MSLVDETFHFSDQTLSKIKLRLRHYKNKRNKMVWISNNYTLTN